MRVHTRIDRAIHTLALSVMFSVSLLARPASGAGPEWREITPPPAVHDHTLLYDEAGQRLLVLGGWRAPNLGPLSDLWSFVPGPGWKRMPGKAPMPVRGAGLVIDTRRHRLVTFGNLGEGVLWGSRFEVATYSLQSPTDWVVEPNSFEDFGGALGVYDSTRDRIVAWRNSSDFSLKDALTREFRFGGTGWGILATTGDAPSLFAGLGRTHLDRANERMIVVDHATGATWSLALSSMVWTSTNDPGPLPAALIGTGFDQATQALHGFDHEGRIYRRSLAPVAPWELLGTASLHPPDLSIRSSTWDGLNRRFLVHGWTPNEVWSLSPEVSADWQLLAPARPSAPLSLGNAMCLDTRRHEVILQTGYYTYPYVSYCYHPVVYRLQYESVASFSLPLNSGSLDWNAMPVTGSAPNSSLVYDPTRDRVLYFGGQYRRLAYCGHDHDVFHTSSRNTGFAFARGPTPSVTPFDVTSAPPPAPRGYHGAVWDQRRDRMLIAGGTTEDPANPIYTTELADLWQLDGTTLRWSRLTTTGVAPSGPLKLLIDEQRDRLIAIPSSCCNTSIYLLDLQGSAWTQVQPTGGAFSPNAVFMLDPARDRLLIFGEASNGVARNVLWAIQLSDLATTSRLDFPGAPPFGSGHVAVFDPVRGELVLHGGQHPDPWESFLGGEMRSTWILQLEVPTATSVDFASIVPLRDRVRLVVHAPGAGQELEVERRTDQGLWSLRANVHTDGEGDLEWEDLQVEPGERYAYRIAWWDGDARRTTPEREVRLPEAAPGTLQFTSLHPNPVRDMLSLAIALPRPGPVEFVVRDLQGRTVHTERAASRDAGASIYELRPSPVLRPGLYIVTVLAAGASSSRRFLVVR